MFNGRGDVDYRRGQKPRTGGARRRDWRGASRGAHGGYGQTPVHHSGHYSTPADPVAHLRALSYTLPVVGTDLIESGQRITAAVQRYLSGATVLANFEKLLYSFAFFRLLERSQQRLQRLSVRTRQC